MSIRSRMWEKHEVNLGPLMLKALSLSLLLVLSLVAVSQEPPAAQPTPAQVPGPEASSSAPEAAAQGSAPLRVMVGKSLLINTTERLRRVSVTDDVVADAIVVTPTQILVHGRAAIAEMQATALRPGGRKVRFKFYAEGSASVTGSASKEGRGETIVWQGASGHFK